MLFTNLYILVGLLMGLMTNKADTHEQHKCSHTYNLQFVENAEELAKIKEEVTNNKVKWSKYRKIHWSDFKGQPDERLQHIAALTASAIVYSYSCEEDYLDQSVEAVFKQGESWVRPEAMTHGYLDHERLHFDITELYARKLSVTLNNYRFKCDQSDELHIVANRILEEWRQTQYKYDVATKFSHDKRVQSNWYVYIHNQLIDYNNLLVLD